MSDHRDDICTLMLQEPRGNPPLCRNVVVPPCHLDAFAGHIIMEKTEYVHMSGSNTIGLVTELLKPGVIAMQEPVTILTLETPSDLIKVEATCKDGKVERLKFRNLPAFFVHLDIPLEVPEHDTIAADIAWDGMVYVIADGRQFDLSWRPDEGAEMERACETLRAASVKQYPVVYPESPEFIGPTISQLTCPPGMDGIDGVSAASVSGGADTPGRLMGAPDRSPCSTGTCANIAVLPAKGLLKPGRDYVNAGLMGTTSTGHIEDLTKVGPRDAINPSLSAHSWTAGLSKYKLGPDDPFQTSFTVTDIWAG